MAYQRKTADEWEILGNYGRWEMVTTESTWRDAKATLHLYRENEPRVPFKAIKRRVPIQRKA